MIDEISCDEIESPVIPLLDQPSTLGPPHARSAGAARRRPQCAAIGTTRTEEGVGPANGDPFGVPSCNCCLTRPDGSLLCHSRPDNSE